MPVNKKELIGRVRELSPRIAELARKTEEANQPLDEIIDALIDAEVMETLVPRRWGGHELGLDTHIAIVEEISAACMSTGWVTAFYMGHNAMVLRHSEKAQSEIFDGKPYGLIPVTTAPSLRAKRVAGGWEASGRAPWGSCVMRCDWVALGAMTDEGTFRQLLIPREDVTVDKVWDMSGMAGTGSNDIIVDGAFVPDHRTEDAQQFAMGQTEGAKLIGSPLSQMPLLPLIYLETMGVFSGGLRGATNAFQQGCEKRVRSHTQSATNEKPQVHIHLGEASANALIAERLVQDLLTQTEALIASEKWEVADRVRLKAHAGYIVDLARRAVNDIMNQSGSSAFNRDMPVQRFFRDINMLATHAFWEWDMVCEQYGRTQLGLEPNHPLV